MEKSTHKVEVVPVEMEKHPNADILSVVKVFGYTCCVNTKQFEGVSRGAYIPPDSVVRVERSEFSFLKNKAKEDGTYRIRVVRLRGVISQGLLLPARPEWNLGDNVADELEVTHYEPPEPMSTGGEAEKGPEGYYPVFDVDSFYRYPDVFHDGELVVITEKIHGSSARYTFADGRLFCGSRREWKKQDKVNVYWQAAEQNPWIEEFLKAHPGFTLYGEVFGKVQKLRYGAKENERRFLAFDILRGNEWLSWGEVLRLGLVREHSSSPQDHKWVPLIYHGPFEALLIPGLADGRSHVVRADHIREGIVIRPAVERTDLRIGRVILKAVSNAYLEKDK